MSEARAGARNLALFDFDVAAFAQFITTAFVIGVNDASGILINHLLSQPVSRLLIDLMKAGLV